MDKKENIFQFLHSQTHMVLSTVGKDGNPQAAWVGFGENNDLTLIFGTDSTSRKYQNILQNPNVAITVSDDLKTVQYEGKAELLKRDELETNKKLYFSKTPSAQEYEYAPNQIFLKIVPKWIRFTDYSVEPLDIFEITL